MAVSASALASAGVESRWVLHLDMDAFYRVRRAADPAHAARTAGAGRRAGRTRRGRRRQLRGPRVRRPIGDADASGPPPGRRPRRGAAAARRGLRRGQPPRARHGPQRRARPRTAVLRRGLRRTRRTRRRVGRATSRPSARRCGPRVRDETGLVASVGAGSGKQIAKIASGLAKPDGIRVVRRDEERVLLRRPSGAAAVGDRPGRRGEAAPARHRHHRRLRRAVRRRGRQHPRRRPSGPRCTSSPAASTTGPSPRTPRPSRSAPNPPSPKT